MAENTIQKLILGFLVLIVGTVLIGSIAVGTEGVTAKLGVGSETLDIASARLGTGNCPMSMDPTVALTIVNAPTSWKSEDCPITDFVMLNQTDVAALVTTDYVFFDNNGTLYLKNTTRFVGDDCAATSNTTTLSYIYCGDDYINSAWGRSVLDLVSGFFAIALLGVGIGIFYSIAKDNGIIGK